MYILCWPTHWSWNVWLSSYRVPVTTVLLTGLIVQLVKSEFISSSSYHSSSNWSHSSACKIKADHYHLLLRLRMHGAIPSFSIFMAWSLIRHEDYSTLTILLSFCSRSVLYQFQWLVTLFGVLWLRVLKESIRNISRFILKKICAS